MHKRLRLLAMGAAISASAILIAQRPPAPAARTSDANAQATAAMAQSPLGGAAAGFVRNPSLDTAPPQLPPDLRPGGVLVFTKTTFFRDETAIQASKAALAAIATLHGWPYFTTENGAVMNPEQLSKFKLVVWSNNSGNVLTEPQRAAFKAWVEQGGTYLGIHGAGGDPANLAGVAQGAGGADTFLGVPVSDLVARKTLADWKWYIDDLLGAQFKGHSAQLPGDIHVEDVNSPLMKGLPKVWHRTDEWYGFAENPRRKPGFHILLTADEKSYAPGQTSMGADHPLAWWHCVGKGRAMYSALGHAGSYYAEPLMIRLLENTMTWGVTESGKACSAGD